MMKFADVSLVVLDANVTSVLILISVFLLFYITCTKKPRGIPPGPVFTLPVIGDIPLLIGGDVLEIFRKLRRKNGDVFSFYFGNDLTIVINGYNSIQKAAVRKGQLFSGRPGIFINSIVGEGKGIIFAQGEFWKRQRKYTHSSLQEFGFGKVSFEENILREVKGFVDVASAKQGTDFDIREYIHASVANIVFAIVGSKRYEHDDGVFQSLLADAELAAKKALEASVLLNCAPFLQFIPGDPFKLSVLKTTRVKWNTMFSQIITEHKKTIDKNNPRDFIDVFIIEMLRQNNVDTEHESDFSVEQLVEIMRDLFGAGTETTATTIRWAVLYLLNFPDIKLRLQSDIDSVIAGSQLPRLDDRPKLPYMEAFIMEVLRCVNVAPLAIPHAVTAENDVLLEGYRIPKNSFIILNLDSVLKDPDLFNSPEQFNPDRFLDADGNIVKPKEFIPFGIGRRVCLGEALAKMELFLFLTTMIRMFDFRVPDDGPPPSLEGVLGVTFSPKPYKVQMIPRTVS